MGSFFTQNVSRPCASVQNKVSAMIGFGRALRERANKLGLSDTEVARRAGLEVGRYGNYARDSREPDLATLVRISKVLLTTPNALLGIEDLPETEQDEFLAAFNILDADGRQLALKVLRTIAEHQASRGD